jgi:ABC-type Na+ transport system ATPase subunit NatA
VSIRDTTYSTKVLVNALVPLIVIVIFTKAMTAAQTQAGAQVPPSNKKANPPPPSSINIHNIYHLIYIAAVELSLLSYISTGCIFRVSEHENRILNFLFVFKGRKTAYKLANYTYDVIELLVVVLFTMVGTKMIAFGMLNITLKDLLICALVLVHNFAKVLFLGYPLSLLFNSKKNLLNYYNLLNMAFVFILLGGAVYSFSHAEEEGFQFKLLNYLNITKIFANCIVATIPDKVPELVPFRNVTAELFGGLLPNLLIMLLHLISYYALNIILEEKKYRLGVDKVKPKKNATDAPEVANTEASIALIRNSEEINEERDYVDTQRPQISVEGVEKTHPNGYTGARNITFGVEQNKIFTLLGPNGAGKSSLLDVLCGINNRTAGEIHYEGTRLEDYKMRGLSFCLQKNYLWEYLTFEEHIDIIGRWRGLDEETIKDLKGEIDKGLDIGKNMRIKAIHLSGGNQRKLNTVLALLSAPRIYILDEPTAGMDPKSRRYFWNILNTWKKKSSCSLILTTHTANEAEVYIDSNN